ncbi:MAG: OmpA family protein [Ignavibacteriae bacterium]|nr:OmpA family protein [Ignavibacteriota bacterium]
MLKHTFIFLFLITVSISAQPKKQIVSVPSFNCKVRLPGVINSYRPTIQPLLTPDGKRLYFDRKYHPLNMGMNKDCDDIWYSDRNSDGSWNTPVNVGPPLNTSDCDVLFSISPDGKTALVGGEYENGIKHPGFSITKWDGRGWGTPQKDTACIVSSDSVNELEGIYFVCLPTEVRPQKVNLEKLIKETPKEKTFLPKIYFESKESTLSVENQELLEKSMSSLKQAKEIIVTGYADDIGTDGYNMNLSKLRATSVREFLEKKKVGKIKVVAKGENALKDTTPTDEVRRENRRVDIEVR